MARGPDEFADVSRYPASVVPRSDSKGGPGKGDPARGVGVRRAGALMLLAAAAAFLGVGVGRTAGQEAVQLGVEAACLGLDGAECCAQTLATHSYRVTREPLARKPQLVADLMCRAAAKTDGRKLSPKGCQSLWTALGRPLSAAKRLCRAKGLTRRCQLDEACKACVADMAKLGFAGSDPACLALTRRPAGKRRGKVVLGPQDSGGQGAVIKKRRVLK